jgi:hypothetical protein
MRGYSLHICAAALSYKELERKGSIPAFGGEVSVDQMLELVVFQSSRQHFDSMKTAVG